MTPWTVHGVLQARILEGVAFPFSRGSSQPRDRTQVPALQADSLPAEPQGKPKNTGAGSLSLLQWIFLTQGLLHCKQILYQLSYQGSPIQNRKALTDFLEREYRFVMTEDTVFLKRILKLGQRSNHIGPSPCHPSGHLQLLVFI